MQAARASSRYGDAGEEVAWCAGAVAFEAEQVFTGPEDGLDPLPDRCEVDTASAARSRVAVAARSRPGGDGRSELAAGVALVADDRLAAASARGRSVSAISRSGWSAETSAAARGVPSGAQARCSRIPQNQREWLGE